MKNTLHIVFVGCAALPVCASGAPLDGGDAPVAISECTPSLGKSVKVTHELNAQGQYETTTTTPVGSGPKLKVTFTNERPDVAKEVRIALIEGNRVVQAVDDTGTFAKGASIRHTFPLSPSVSPLGLSQARCAVFYVKYANGAVWTH